MVLMEKNGFKVLDKERYVIKETIPEHTGKKLEFKTMHFINISVDSLNKLVVDQNIKAIDIQSTTPFRFYQKNIPTVANKFKGDYINELILEKIINPKKITDFSKYINPKIQTLREQIRLLQSEQEQKQNYYNKQKKNLDQLKNQIHTETDLAKKERILKQINRLAKIKTPESDLNKILVLESKIKELQLADQIKNQEKQFEFQKQLNQTFYKQTLLTGFITIINIAKKEAI